MNANFIWAILDKVNDFLRLHKKFCIFFGIIYLALLIIFAIVCPFGYAYDKIMSSTCDFIFVIQYSGFFSIFWRFLSRYLVVILFMVGCSFVCVGKYFIFGVAVFRITEIACAIRGVIMCNGLFGVFFAIAVLLFCAIFELTLMCIAYCYYSDYYDCYCKYQFCNIWKIYLFLFILCLIFAFIQTLIAVIFF